MTMESASEEPLVTQALQKIALPNTTIEAVHIAKRIRRIETWADRIAMRAIPMPLLAFSAVLVKRFDAEYAPGSRALDFAQRLLPDTLATDDVELTVSPYAPPMRQLSGVRQGVPMWSGSSPPRAASRQTSVARPAAPPSIRSPQRRPQDAKNRSEIPADLLAILNAHRALEGSQ